MKRFLILFATVAAIACSLSFLYLHSLRKKGTERPLAAFKEGDFQSCERLLKASEPVTFPLALFNSYLCTARGHFTESDYFLQTILQSNSISQSPELLVQVYLTQAINTYLTGRDEELSPLIDRAKHLSQNSSVLMFFDGLSCYSQGRYDESVRYWSAYREENDWMSALINHCFPASWRQLHLAHSLCEIGNKGLSREILEKENHLLDRDPYSFRQLAALFLGLTYLREAQELPLWQRSSHYKLATFYFEHSGREMRFDRERECVSNAIAQETAVLATQPSQTALIDWALVFLETLEEWGAREQLTEVAEELAQTIVLRRDESYLYLCQKLCSHFAGGYFHTLMIDSLLNSLQEGIQRKEGDALCYIWQILESLSDNPKAMKREISRLITNELFEIIHSDCDTLIETRHYLAFWKQLKQEQTDCEKLGQQLLNYGQLFWKKEGSERKGTLLLQLANDFCIDKQTCQNRIETFLSDLYGQAESSNMIQRLSLIHDALDAFNIVVKEVGDVEKLANHLADAEYLYEARNWGAAKTHASWVLKLDPTNFRAQRLVGLSYFHMGEYKKAIDLLQKLPILDETVHKAIAFSRVYQAQEKAEHLVQKDNIDSFDEDE